MTPAQILVKHPHLTMAGIYAALAYYWDHQDEIQQELREEKELVERLKQEVPSILQQKLAGGNAQDHSIPS